MASSTAESSTHSRSLHSVTSSMSTSVSSPVAHTPSRSQLLRPYKCPLCDKAFHRLEHQTRHIRTHTGEKPHACIFPGCSRRFSRSDELTRHSRIHRNPNSRRSLKHAAAATTVTPSASNEHAPTPTHTMHVPPPALSQPPPPRSTSSQGQSSPSSGNSSHSLSPLHESGPNGMLGSPPCKLRASSLSNRRRRPKSQSLKSLSRSNLLSQLSTLPSLSSANLSGSTVTTAGSAMNPQSPSSSPSGLTCPMNINLLATVASQAERNDDSTRPPTFPVSMTCSEAPPKHQHSSPNFSLQLAPLSCSAASNGNYPGSPPARLPSLSLISAPSSSSSSSSSSSICSSSSTSYQAGVGITSQCTSRGKLFPHPPTSPQSTAPSSPSFSHCSTSPTPDHTPLATPGHSPRLRTQKSVAPFITTTAATNSTLKSVSSTAYTLNDGLTLPTMRYLNFHANSFASHHQPLPLDTSRLTSGSAKAATSFSPPPPPQQHAHYTAETAAVSVGYERASSTASSCSSRSTNSMTASTSSFSLHCPALLEPKLPISSLRLSGSSDSSSTSSPCNASKNSLDVATVSTYTPTQNLGSRAPIPTMYREHDATSDPLRISDILNQPLHGFQRKLPLPNVTLTVAHANLTLSHTRCLPVSL